MNDDQRPTDEQLAAYQDGALSESERQALEKALDEHARSTVGQFTMMDEALRRKIQFSTPDQQSVGDSLQQPKVPAAVVPPATARVNANGPRRKLILLASLAATVTIAMFAWQYLDPANDRRGVVFRQRSFVEIYRETVRMGFEPYYECDDAQRFADTFLRRQGKPLKLAKMPEGRYMLGLSYPGGLSRETTAMLCRVDDQPVMVFVDREEEDNRSLAKTKDESLMVHRAQRDGLVFYEVTPVPEKNVTQFLRLGQAPSSTP